MGSSRISGANGSLVILTSLYLILAIELLINEMTAKDYGWHEIHRADEGQTKECWLA
jgi:hypothetical protein